MSLLTMNNNNTILNPYWVSGFTDGDCTFQVGIYRNSSLAWGYQVQLEFCVTQHSRDLERRNWFPFLIAATWRVTG